MSANGDCMKLPDYEFTRKRALYVRDEKGIMRRVGTYINSQFIMVAGSLYTIRGD